MTSRTYAGWRRAASLAATVVLVAALAAPASLAQKAEEPPETPPGTGDSPVIVGPLKPRIILDVTPEWSRMFREYQPDPASIEMISSVSEAFSAELKVEVVVGTWCSDSRREVPRFIKMQRKLSKNRLKVSYWGVDRSKQSPAEAVEGKSIEKVPTFIVYYKGEELGRITEKPQLSVEADLAEILSKAGKS